MVIKENMYWPPMGSLYQKQQEHSAWYSGSAEVLASHYETHNYGAFDNFWGRQHKNDNKVCVHIPIAGDIAETSANFLFSESPTIRIATEEGGESPEEGEESPKEDQKILDDMLTGVNLYAKLIEAAESCSAIGGVYIKLAWDSELSKYPIPVIEQADRAVPEFNFGMLTAVTFWRVIDVDESKSKVHRLLERYEKGAIISKLYLGSADRLGSEVELTAHPLTEAIEPVVQTIDRLLAVYIPNMLPNRLDRSSSHGRSDYSGIEGLMNSLDEVYTSWMKDIVLAQAKLLVPESFLQKTEEGSTYNLDKMLYVKLDVDPVVEGAKITPQQFAIRAQEFEQTALNLLERIITSAGYSPQSFGLNIQGRAESGTALSLRERKSFATKGKKENYWHTALTNLINMMVELYSVELGGGLNSDLEINISFNDGITNDMNETATSVKMLSDAQAASTDTKVRLLHPEWDEDQIQAEIERVMEENHIGAVSIPEGNWDISQLGLGDE